MVQFSISIADLRSFSIKKKNPKTKPQTYLQIELSMVLQKREQFSIPRKKMVQAKNEFCQPSFQTSTKRSLRMFTHTIHPHLH